MELIHEIYAQASDFVAELGKRRSSPDLQREALEMIATNRAADLREQRTLAWHRDGMLPARYYQLLNKLRTAEADSILSETRKKEVDGLLRQTRVDLGLLETQLAMEPETLFRRQRRRLTLRKDL